MSCCFRRFILADTDKLHRKISEMSNRIRQLEEALALLQAVVSGERHPLLQDELLKIKFGAEAPQAADAMSPKSEGSPHLSTIDGLGALTLGDSGEMKYYGRSAGSQVSLPSNRLCVLEISTLSRHS